MAYGDEDIDDAYETEDEAQDPRYPYPHIVAELNWDLGAEVLHVAVPSFVPTSISRLPNISRSHMTIALACADTTVRFMAIPLAPPAPGTHQEYLENEVTEIELQGSKAVSRDLAIKVTLPSHEASPQSAPQSRKQRTDSEQIVIASVGSTVSVWSLALPSGSLENAASSLQPQLQIPVPISHVSFQTSPGLDKLLLTDISGIVRIVAISGHDTSDSTSARPVSPTDHVRYIMSFQTPFHAPDGSNPVLARRKKILSAAWVLGGRGILVLLEDGQWGVWDLFANNQTIGKTVQEYSLQGYLATSSTESATQASQKKSGGPKLAPMTPNTRKQKSENLFAGASKSSNAASLGGISVSHTTTKSGSSDESIVLWYNNAVYSINSMQAFWQRSTSNANGGDRNSFGGLYAPGLTHITDINLMNENITSISQFAPRSTIPASSLGPMNAQNDILVSAEHRYVIFQQIQPQIQSRVQLQPAVERPMPRDQLMLDAGEADLGGMNRILDGMAGDGRVRRVGFAS